MADIKDPSSLPTPQASTVTPAERRALATQERPRSARLLERDQRELERQTWPAMNAEQVEAFDQWWRNTLVFGGAWFSAKWPLPRGFVTAVRKFVSPITWTPLGRGYWRASALLEVRGESVTIVNNSAWEWGGAGGSDTGPGGGGGDELIFTIVSPGALFSEEDPLLNPAQTASVDGLVLNVDNGDISIVSEFNGVYYWLGYNADFFNVRAVEFTITSGDPTARVEFGVGRADDQGTTGGSGLYFNFDGDLVSSDPEDVQTVEVASGPLAAGDVLSFTQSGNVIGAVDVYRNGEFLFSMTGRSRDFFLRPPQSP